MITVTANQLEKLGATKEDSLKYVDYLNETMERFNINTKERVCHFLAQIYVESGCLSKVRESLNYSAKRMMEIWPTRFPTLESTVGCVMNTEGLAAKVYEGRKNLGNTQPGDGKKFLGRGLKQLTGRDNVNRCGNYLNVDFISNPSLLEQPKYASLSAGWFWHTNNLNLLADVGGVNQVAPITKKVNGGDIGLKNRQDYYIKAKGIF